MVDPREYDPQFPDRPQHEDFYLLSEVVQEIDEEAATEDSPFDVINIDEHSLRYMADTRCSMAVLKVRRGSNNFVMDSSQLSVLLNVIYTDAFATGKRFGERRMQA